MKKLALALAAAALLTLPTYAQVATAEANVPFAFTAGHLTLSAGKYVIGTSAAPFKTALVDPDRNGHFLAISPGRDSIGAPTLVFNRYGNQYFLHAVVNAYAAVEFRLPEVRAERELVKTAGLHQEQVLAVLARR